jgi:hypothetical protein
MFRSLSRHAWKAVALYAYRRWAEGCPTPPVGTPFVRDPADRCVAYAPRKPRPDDWCDCEGDGHYLCKACAHLDPQSKTEQGWDR